MKGTFELSAGSEREVMLPFDGTVRGLRISVVATTRDVEFSCRMYQSMSGGEGSGSGGGDRNSDGGSASGEAAALQVAECFDAWIALQRTYPRTRLD